MSSEKRHKTPSTVASIESDDTVLSLEEAVRFLNTSKPTLYRLLRQGDVNGMKAGRQWRFRRSDLMSYLQRDTVASTAPAEALESEIEYFRYVDTGTQEKNLERSGPSAVVEASTDLRELANAILTHAIRQDATDIHIERARLDRDQILLVRYRMDGMLHEIRRSPSSLHEPLVQQFKLMAEMNVSERRLPQDGRYRIDNGVREYDIRVSIVPSLYGEALTMKILDRTSVLIGLGKLGLYPDDVARLRTALAQPKGTIVMTGPTGSGKSTLLYSCLAELADGHRKAMSIEDPVEYQLPYVTQANVNRKVGFNFAAALRSFLRSDPDVVMSSEVRDLETAELLTEISLTGHLVLTSLHPNTAPETFRRLIDMGIMPFLVAQTVILAVGVRLARRLCPRCKVAEDPDDISAKFGRLREKAMAGGYQIPDNAVFYRGAGCDECRGTGFRGRIGLFEFVPVYPRMMEAIARNASAEEIAHLARGASLGLRSLAADGARKAVDGITTIDEVLRVVPTEE